MLCHVVLCMLCCACCAVQCSRPSVTTLPKCPACLLPPAPLAFSTRCPLPPARRPQPNVNVNAQQGGFGIIPTLFGLQNSNGACPMGRRGALVLIISLLQAQLAAAGSYLMPACSWYRVAYHAPLACSACVLLRSLPCQANSRSHTPQPHRPVAYAGNGGYAEPLTPEQQHQAFLSRLLLMLGSFVSARCAEPAVVVLCLLWLLRLAAAL